MDSFGSAAIDIDLLEKEIAAKEQARSGQQFIDVSGDIAGAAPPKPQRSQPANVESSIELGSETLDEPVWDSVKRDLRMVVAKFGQVLIPRSNHQLLRDWDLWGPLFICVFTSILLQSDDSNKGPHFSEVFSLTFFGSCVVTLNIKLLGGHISFFQSLCVLGYCLLPPSIAAVICRLIAKIGSSKFLFVSRCFITLLGFSWATVAAMAFLAASHSPKRNLLSVYPIFLFYFVISWMIIIH
ncbi:hypothetical protein AB6A40_001623 [Gnathostoma spinigerum]|uniref:Protein YIPF n=1 Tax=Gnathostoma spinigerum TaxID=75299 RepID=A0ABD6EC46_9BILA